MNSYQEQIFCENLCTCNARHHLNTYTQQSLYWSLCFAAKQTFCISLSMRCENMMSNFYKWRCHRCWIFYAIASIECRLKFAEKIWTNTCRRQPQFHHLDIWLITTNGVSAASLSHEKGIWSPPQWSCKYRNRLILNVKRKHKQAIGWICVSQACHHFVDLMMILLKTRMSVVPDHFLFKWKKNLIKNAW